MVGPFVGFNVSTTGFRVVGRGGEDCMISRAVGPSVVSMINTFLGVSVGHSVGPRVGANVGALAVPLDGASVGSDFGALVRFSFCPFLTGKSSRVGAGDTDCINSFSVGCRKIGPISVPTGASRPSNDGVNVRVCPTGSAWGELSFGTGRAKGDVFVVYPCWDGNCVGEKIDSII